MRKSFYLKFWGESNAQVNAVGSRPKPNGSDCEVSSARALVRTEASFGAAENVRMTESHPYVEESWVQPPDAAGEDQFISQSPSRTMHQSQPGHVHGLRDNNKRLAKSLAASSQMLAPELHDLENYKGQLQRRSSAHAESSQPHKETWNNCTVGTGGNASKVPQEEAAFLRKELEAQKESQSQSNGTMETLKVPLDKLAARQKPVQACTPELLHKQNNDQHLNDVRNQLAYSQQKAQAFEAEVLRMRNYERDLHETRKTLVASQQELRECKDDLFRLQPVAQATDADISRDFESLCQRINDWVESEMSLFEEGHPNVQPGQMFSAFGSPELNTLMQKYSDIGEYQIRKMIHHGLQKIMFGGDVYLFGMPLNLVQTLQRAEQSMAMLEPRREYTTIDTWRSETLAAVSADQDFADQRRRRLEEASKDLFRNLSNVFPIIIWNHQSFTGFYYKVMFPAADLASIIQTSTSSYDFEMPKDILLDSVLIRSSDLAAFRLIEVQTGQTLRSSSKVIPNSHGFIGKAILPLEPSLQRKNRGHRSTKLRQACYLVKLDKPYLKGNKDLK